jgi:hypothetical protein
MDLFPRAAILPHLEYRRIFFRCPSNTLYLRPRRRKMHLGMCASGMRGCSLCGRLLVRTHAQRFGKDREMEVLRDMWQLELEIVGCLIPDPGAF